MLGFVTSLRHPDNMQSPQRVYGLLQAMLRSVARQEDPNHCAVVVTNALSKRAPDLSGVSQVEVAFPAPCPKGTVRIDYRLRMLDKGAKLVVGALRARAMGATHVMFFDYDDVAHHELSRHCNSHPAAAGWYSPNGFIHTHGMRWVTPVVGDFHKKCGSTSIVRVDLMGLPEHLDVDASFDDVIASAGEDYLIKFIGEHSRRPSTLAERGIELEPLPFASAIWEIGTGENVSGSLIAGGTRTAISAELQDAFGLSRPSLLRSGFASARTTLRRAVRRVRPWND